MPQPGAPPSASPDLPDGARKRRELDQWLRPPVSNRDDATRARAVLEQSRPRFTKDVDREFMRGVAGMERFKG